MGKYLFQGDGIFYFIHVRSIGVYICHQCANSTPSPGHSSQAFLNSSFYTYASLSGIYIIDPRTVRVSSGHHSLLLTAVYCGYDKCHYNLPVYKKFLCHLCKEHCLADMAIERYRRKSKEKGQRDVQKHARALHSTTLTALNIQLPVQEWCKILLGGSEDLWYDSKF